MAAYCFYRLDKGERIVGMGEYRDCEDDLAALEAGKQLVNGYAIDVWRGARFVAHLKAWDAPLTAADPSPGARTRPSPEGE